MYILYLSLCYLSISLSASYILLAANLEDFRSLARRIAPEKITDQIISFAADKNKAKDEEYDESETEESTSAEEEAAESEPTHVQRGINMKKPIKATASSYDLDDLVAKVKQKLQEELTEIASKTVVKYTPEAEYDDETPTEAPTFKKMVISSKKEHKGFIKQSKDGGRHEDKDRNLSNERYAESKDSQHSEPAVALKYLDKVQVAPVPKQLRQQKQKQERGSIQQERKISRPKHITEQTTEEVTTDILNLFHGVDMLKEKDSYEDYVLPKKDDNYYEPKSAKYNIKKKKANIELFTDEMPSEQKYNIEKKKSNIKLFTNEMPPVQKNPKKKIEISSENYETVNNNNKKTTDDIDYEETTKFSKLRNVERLTAEASKNIKRQPKGQHPKAPKPIIEAETTEKVPVPYAEQFAVTPEYADETEATVTDELKARTESIKEDNTNIRLEVPRNMTNPNLSYKYKNKRPSKSATVIPKRDFYKMSTPNFIAKLPKVAETYNFNEPLPEGDREPENLNPIANPPSSINGKIKMS